MSYIKKSIKSDKWWHYKIPPLLAIAYYLILVSEPVIPFKQAIINLGLFLLASIGIAGFGHIINDLFDVEFDSKAGKTNAMKEINQPRRILFIGLLLAVAWIPWLFLPINRYNLSLLVLQFILLIIYSMPPIRLKERGGWGVLTDALYGYTVPFLVTYSTFIQLGTNYPASVFWLVYFLGLWSIFGGVRGILNHQVKDADNDLASGIHTFGAVRGQEKLMWILSRIVVPIEIILYLLVVITISFELTFFIFGFIFYFLWRIIQIKYLWVEDLDPFKNLDSERFTRFYGYVVLNEFYQKWWPIFMLAGLILNTFSFVFLAIIHIAIFNNAVFEFFSHDLKNIPNGLAKIRNRFIE